MDKKLINVFTHYGMNTLKPLVAKPLAAKVFVMRLLVATIAVAAAGCSKTTVMLDTDPNGKVGRVVVMDINKPSTVLSDIHTAKQALITSSVSTNVVQFTDRTVPKSFVQLNNAQPAPVQRFTLIFKSGFTDVQPTDQPTLSAALAALTTRPSCDNSIIGHSDTVGNNTNNEAISRNRAEKVLAALVAMGATPACFDLRFYGENDLAVKTADEVDEPANRRVEIEVR